LSVPIILSTPGVLRPDSCYSSDANSLAAQECSATTARLGQRCLPRELPLQYALVAVGPAFRWLSNHGLPVDGRERRIS